MALSPGFILEKVFRQVCRQQNQNITVRHLCDFIERWDGKNVTDAEIEAILRRVDHDGDLQISFDEFCELLCLSEHH